MSPRLVPTLREFRPSDRAFVQTLSKSAFAEYTPWSGRRTVAMAERGSSVTFIAELAGVPVGFAIVDFASEGVATLDAIASVESERGTGIGRALLEQVEHEVRRHSLSRLRLVTAEANLAALDLFLKHGFHIEQHKTAFYPRRQNAVVLEKRV
jgi:ribosomal protein S18 acetylase RimI-like enzyme